MAPPANFKLQNRPKNVLDLEQMGLNPYLKHRGRFSDSSISSCINISKDDNSNHINNNNNSDNKNDKLNGY